MQTPRDKIRRILQQEASKHLCTPEDILGKRRYKEMVAARHAAIKRVSEEFPHFSSSLLARIFNKDHTTILHALGKRGRQQCTKQN